MMKAKNQPTAKEYEVLKHILKSSNQGQEISPALLCMLCETKNTNMSNILGRLEKKGLITRAHRKVFLTENGLDCFSVNSSMTRPVHGFDIVPVDIPIKGQVKAGRTRLDDLIVDIDEDHLNSVGQPLQIPSQISRGGIFALQVIGSSMVHEGILPNDYVIVERFFIDKPKDNELIVARYLPIKNVSDDPDYQYSDEDYEGPTLKYFHREFNNGRERFKLGWRKGNDLNLEVIIAVEVREIGRVIGVYRDIKAKN